MEAQAAVMDLEHRVIRTTAQLGEERRQGNQQRQKQREVIMKDPVFVSKRFK